MADKFPVIVSMTFGPCFSLPGSFGMAYDFIDSVGNDVDVVSDSEVSDIMVEGNLAVWESVGSLFCGLEHLGKILIEDHIFQDQGQSSQCCQLSYWEKQFQWWSYVKLFWKMLPI